MSQDFTLSGGASNKLLHRLVLPESCSRSPGQVKGGVEIHVDVLEILLSNNPRGLVHSMQYIIGISSSGPMIVT